MGLNCPIPATKLLFFFSLRKAEEMEWYCVKSVQIWNFFWSVFSRIRTEYGEIRSTSPYSVRMRENKDQNNSEYAHAVYVTS